MNKQTIYVVLITAIVVLVIGGKLRQLPLVNKIPTV